MKNLKRFLALLLAMFMALSLIGCDSATLPNDQSTYTYDEAVKELESKVKKITDHEVEAKLDLNEDDSELKALADISTFDITVQGRQGSNIINVELAVPSELAGKAPDDFINVIAEQFNKSGQQVNGKTISITIRCIASGEIVTYMVEGGYHPDGAIPSSDAIGGMLQASGVNVIKLANRIAGNTAGILMKRDVYDEFTAKYGEPTMDKVLEAAINGDLVFGVTNPYTSATGLNGLAAMLHAFDPSNPLSDTAVQKLLDYQKVAPAAAYTTGILRDKAAKGIIKAMIMEEQAYINTPELKDYVFTRFGIRHDHPVYTFDYVSAEKQEAIKLFVQYCLSAESQRIASQKGFNHGDDYVSQDLGLDGAGYLAAQRVWKTNKNGGNPVIAVFVADVSGSMEKNGALDALKQSLLATSKYIGSDSYIGLVTYSDQVFVNLKIAQFDATQRSYFSYAVKNLTPKGGTATYDATLVALKMLHDKSLEVPNATLMLFVLSDGDSKHGNYSLSNISNIVAGMRVPIYTIGYNLDGGSAENQLRNLSSINEATLISTDTEGIVNQLRNLFNVNL